LLSLLSWERGLKLWRAKDCSKSGLVAPLVGAWIEMSVKYACALVG